MKFSQSKPLYDALVKVQQAWEEDACPSDDFATLQRKRAVENMLRRRDI